MSEDLRPSGDITTQLLKHNNKFKAKIISINSNKIILNQRADKKERQKQNKWG